ncbi:cache domain-containing protein [Candidatus Chloroploca sp. Khr17]|uniref:sensor histidine kinase n=1 Tax=Candidatus Chloroploca sp. Khr17 TaxID=2496869 RepID=UPI00101B5C53|nr:cache domain-containing protein [Candidatus Chloroploca sp. Khr17]
MRFNPSIQQKILALLLSLALPPLALVGWLGLVGLTRARETAMQEGISALQTQAEQTLADRATDKARLYDQALAAIEQQVQSVATYALTGYGLEPLALTSDRVWIAPVPSADQLQRYPVEVAYAQRIIPMLRATVAANPLVSIGYIAFEQGGVMAFDDEAVVDALLAIQPFDPRTRPWYLAARASNGPVWTDTYVDANTGLLATTCAMPLITPEGTFLGVVAFDLLLRTIQQDLLTVDIGEQGYALLVNERGKVIVRPDMEVRDERWNEPFQTENLLDSPSPELRELVATINGREHGIARIEDKNEPAYIAYAPIPTAGWSVALIIPADQVIAPAVRTGTRIGERQEELQRQLVILLISLGAVISLVGLFLSHSFTRRISSVRQGVQAISQGNLQQRLPPAGTDEIGQLAETFNHMADVLEEKVHELESNAEQLARLNSVSQELKGILDLPHLLKAIPHAICTQFAFDRAVIYLVEDEYLRAVEASFGPGGREQAHHFIEVANSQPLALNGATVEADVIRSGKAIIVDNPWSHPGVEPRKQAASASHAYVQVPIFGREGRPLGLLSADCHLSRRTIGVEDASRLLMFAGMVGLTIENVQLYQDLERQVTQRTEELLVALELAHQADRRKSDFLAGLSHELRTPLNAIIGFSTIMLDGLDGSLTPSQREDLTSINRNGRFLLYLITELLDLARIEAGHLKLERTHVDLVSVVGEVVDTVQGILQGKPLTLHATLPPDLPLVDADADRVRQILLNLLSNAVKFTHKGSVTVSAYCLDELNEDAQIEPMVAVRVTDTGIGIPKERLNDIFQEFVQIHGGQSRLSGTGLGLTITRRLVEAHHGRIWVESVPGFGSTFSFTLPVAQAHRHTPKLPDETVSASGVPHQTIQVTYPEEFVFPFSLLDDTIQSDPSHMNTPNQPTSGER